jgi:hypothetical protein
MASFAGTLQTTSLSTGIQNMIANNWNNLPINVPSHELILLIMEKTRRSHKPRQ